MTTFRQFVDNENHFVEGFNPKNGFYIRSGIIDETGKDTNIDPFMRNMPNLIDIGIMGHCIHGGSGKCWLSGVQCYQNGLSVIEPNMSLNDFQRIIDEVKNYVFQVALGGRGDPNKHEDFEKILFYSKSNNVIPNYTTSGLNLTQEEVELTKKYCGAVAVSWYNAAYTFTAIDRFIKEGCLTNIHFVLSQQSIDQAIYFLKNNLFPESINAVIFLLHKPVGLGKSEICLSPNDERLVEFFDIIDNWNGKHKIGFDSCSMSGILNFTKNINQMSMDACEAARFSMYISSDMIAVPCSFDAHRTWGIDLHHVTIKEAWNSRAFCDFRKTFLGACTSCKDVKNCYGGCPIVPEITLCKKSERTTKVKI